MTGSDLAQLGAVGIIAIALVIVTRAIAPLIQAVVDAMREATEARKAVLKRWDESDATLDKNTNALNSVATYMRELGDSVKRLNDAEQLQAEANRSALQEGVNTIRGELVVAKDDAVNALTKTISSAFIAQEDAAHRDILQVQGDIQRLGSEVAEGTANAVTEVTGAMDESRETILKELSSLRELLSQVRTTEQAEMRGAFSHIDAKLDMLISLAKHEDATPTAETPVAPEPPTTPPEAPTDETSAP